MGSFFMTVSYSRGINRCGYRIIQDYKMGLFGNFLFLRQETLTRMKHELENGFLSCAGRAARIIMGRTLP
jgi:hypothetical protein